MGSERPVDELPEYSGDSAPGYTPQPVLGEERLQISTRLNTNREEAAELFLVERKLVTLTLNERPIYARGARIEGQVALKKTEGIVSVIVKINGDFDIAFALSEKGRTTRHFSILDQETTLYKSQHRPRRFKWRPSSEKRVSEFAAIDITSAAFPEHCPSTLPFAINLPTDDLPPTYMAVNGDKVSELKVDIQYSLEVIATSHGLTEHKHKIFVPIQYRPRSCPAAESSPSLSLTLHPSPRTDDWIVFRIGLPSRNENAALPTISGKIYLPRTRVYATTDPVPFRLRLSSVSKNLLKPFESITSLQDVAGKGSKRLQSSRPIEKSGPTVALSIERHVSFEDKGSAFRFKEILSKVQSSSSMTMEGSTTDMNLTHIEWKGHLEVRDQTRCGGFLVAELGFNIKDFVSLTIKPPNDQFRGIHHLIPIRLTTDPFVERSSLQGMEYVSEIAEELSRLARLDSLQRVFMNQNEGNRDSKVWRPRAYFKDT